MKKLLAVLLSIMMLAMPLTSMAENSVWDNAARQETTITIHNLNADLVAALGGDDTTMAAINDLLAQGSGSEVFYLTHRGAEEPTLLLVEADHSELVKD